MTKHMHPRITFDSKSWSVRQIARSYADHELQLDPVFQRKSVWSDRQRRGLIESIFQGYPIPSIFLYKLEDERGYPKFEVIDGKQRLETLLMYMGCIRGNRFAAPLKLFEWESDKPVDWSRLCQLKKQSLLEDYSVPIVLVTGEFKDIIELFIRLNTTGKALDPQEIRKAKYCDSEFLKVATKLAGKYEAYLLSNNVISKQQIARMKHIELMAELTYAAHIGGVGNKKRVLDTAMRKDGLKGSHLAKARELTVASLNRLAKMFPDLRPLRFHRVSDFYSLAVVIQNFERHGFLLTNKRRNHLAWGLLRELSDGTDDLNLRSKRLDFKTLSPRDELCRQYLQSVKEGSDSEANRGKRHELLFRLLEPLFQRKDSQRGFSEEQRRILWNTADKKVCAEGGCQLTWDDYQADHIRPHAVGGRTTLANAAMLCARHNASKGKRTRNSAV